MGEFNVHVLRFFMLLNNLGKKEISQLAADPSVCEVLGNSFPGGMVNVSEWAVYHLFMYHSNVFTKEMVSDEIINAMSEVFAGESWAAMGRPTLKQIGRRVRAELQGRPTLYLK